MLGIGGDLQQRRRTGAEQEVIEDFLVLQSQRRKLVRQRKDDMDVGDRQQFLLAAASHLSRALVWHLGQWRLRQELKEMACMAAAGGTGRDDRRAPRCGSARWRGGRGDAARSTRTVLLDEAVALRANDVGHLEGWPVHLLC